jgi:hypothetical protein
MPNRQNAQSMQTIAQSAKIGLNKQSPNRRKNWPIGKKLPNLVTLVVTHGDPLKFLSKALKPRNRITIFR